MERFLINHNKTTNILTIEVTEKVAFEIIKIFREQFPIEFLNMDMEYVTVTTDEGAVYQNVRRYSMKITADKVDHIFEAGKKMLRKSIGQSFTQSDN